MKKCIITVLLFLSLHSIALHGADAQQEIPEINEININPPTLHPERSWESICKDAKNAVVQIFSYVGIYNLLEPFKTPEQLEGRGSGFFINDQGEILTNFHVVSQAIATHIQIPSIGKDRFEVEFIGANPDRDIALLRLTPESLDKIKQKLELQTLDYLPLGNSDTLSEAQEIMALGYPLGEENLKASIGSCSGRESTHIGECIQTTAPISPGNSGGPFFDKLGNVVGISSLKSIEQHAEGIAYLIPINNITIMMDELHEKKIVKNPFWGFSYIPTTSHTLRFLSNPDDGGVYVTEVKKGSLVEKYGLEKGDIVYTINDEKIDRYGYLHASWSNGKVSFSDFIARIKLGATVNLTIYRQGEMIACSGILKSADTFAIEQYHPWIYPPLDFEIIGGMVITPLTLNHIQMFKEFARNYPHAQLDVSLFEKYEDPEKRLNPRLVITAVYPTSLIHETRCFQAEDRIIRSINGTKVYSLDDLRNVIWECKDEEYITIETKGDSFAAIPFKEALAEEDLLSEKYYYPKTPFVTDLQQEILGSPAA